MKLLARILAWLDWEPLRMAPRPRLRRTRAVCEYCGKECAVIASTGRLWKHDEAPGMPCRPMAGSAAEQDTET